MSVRFDLRGPSAWLTIDREERRNALNPEVIEGIVEGLERAGTEQAVRAVVITGAGDRAFCAGADIGGFAAAAGREGAGAGVKEQIGRLLRAIREHPQPVVARVNGRALGGGFGLMLACDLVVAADDVEVGTPEIDLGLWPHVITAVIHRNVPRKVALEMMMTARRLPATEAARWGLVNRAVPREELDGVVGQLVETLASKSPHVLRLGKASFLGAEGLDFDEAITFLGDMLARNLQAADLAEGVSAFLQKRKPDWKGR